MNWQLFRGAVLPLVAWLVFAGDCLAKSRKEIFQETVEKIYPLQGNARFRLKNGDGSVWIYGANISEMKVRAVKKSYRKDRLAQIDVKIDVKPDSVTIDTDFPPKPKWGLTDRSGTVDYLVILPWFCVLEKVELGTGELFIEGMRGDAVHAEVDNGRMFGRNCFTNLHFSLSSGSLDVGYDWWETHPIGLDARIENGNTRVFLPAEAQFRLHAETGHGLVLTDFANNRPSGVTGKLDLAVGASPDTGMNIQTGSGSVLIKQINR